MKPIRPGYLLPSAALTIPPKAIVPALFTPDADLISRSGMIAEMKVKNAEMKDPTRVKILGHVVDERGEVLNTRNFPIAKPRAELEPRASVPR